MFKVKIKGQGLLCAVLMLFFTGFSVMTSAQSYPTMVNPTLASQILEQAIPVLAENVASEAIGTPARAVAQRTLDIYVHTFEELAVGNSLEDALSAAYGQYAVNTSTGSSANLDELLATPFDHQFQSQDAVFDALVDVLKL